MSEHHCFWPDKYQSCPDINALPPSQHLGPWLLARIQWRHELCFWNITRLCTSVAAWS